jgi:hypothetical protein
MVEGGPKSNSSLQEAAIVIRCHEDSGYSSVGLEHPSSDRLALIFIKKLVTAIGDGRLQELLHRLSCLAVYPR